MGAKITFLKLKKYKKNFVDPSTQDQEGEVE